MAFVHDVEAMALQAKPVDKENEESD